MPLISVIIPVYNGEKTIQLTIDSVLKQTFSDFELIVINSASTDSTLEIVSCYKDERIKIYSYERANVAVNRNRGIKHACGSYLTFLDADDLWTPDKLEAQYKALIENPECGVAYSWTDYIDVNGSKVKAGRRITYCGDIYSKLLLSNCLENGSNPLIRSSALENVGGFNEELAAAQDWDMWLRLSAEYEFVLVPQAQILYRVSMYSMSTNVKRLEAASLEVIQSAFNHPKAKTLQHLKKCSLANLYKYLAFKVLDLLPNQQNRYMSAKFLWNCVKYDPSVLQQWRVMLIAGVKIAFPQFSQLIKQLLDNKKLVKININYNIGEIRALPSTDSNYR